MGLYTTLIHELPDDDTRHCVVRGILLHLHRYWLVTVAEPTNRNNF